MAGEEISNTQETLAVVLRSACRLAMTMCRGVKGNAAGYYEGVRSVIVINIVVKGREKK